MKKFRATIILLVLCAALVTYVVLFDKDKIGTDQREQIVNVNRSRTVKITLRNAEGTIEFAGRDDLWRVTAPVAEFADADAMRTLFTSLEGLDYNIRPVPPAKDKDHREVLKELGLAKGDISLKLQLVADPREKGSKDGEIELLIGKDTPVEGRVYARIEGRDGIYVMPAEIRNQLVRGLKDWRDRKLARITTAEVNKIIVKTARGEIEAENKNNHWLLVRPLKCRADDQKMKDLISNATAPRIEEFIADAKDAASHGLGDPRATLSFFTEGEKEPVVIQIGAPKQPEKTDRKDKDKEPPQPTVAYVKSSTRATVVTVPIAIESLALTQPNDLRDTSLMRVQDDIVDRITIEPTGGKKIVIARDGESWKRKVEGKPDERINDNAANTLLATLVNTKVSRFVEDVASDLKKYGLDQPRLAVMLGSYSTEGTPESSPGEKPIVRVLFGTFEGDAGYAKLDDEPFIVAVPSTVLAPILTDPIQWQETSILNLNKADIATLEIVRNGQPAVALSQDKEKGWQLAKGDAPVAQAAAQSLVNTLSELRAARWLGPVDNAAHGFEKPAIAVAWTMADKKSARLLIGGLSPDGFHYATMNEKPGTFLLPVPTVGAFDAPLIEGQKPADSETKPPEAGPK